MRIATFIVSICRWSLVPCRVHFRSGLHFDSVHLRRDAHQPAAHQFHQRRF
jgi:hypothetical protein